MYENFLTPKTLLEQFMASIGKSRNNNLDYSFMTDSYQFLFRLVRIALENEHDYSLPNNVKWQEIYNNAKEHGLNGIIMDAFSIMQERDGFSIQSISDGDNLHLRWISDVILFEKEYEKHKNAIAELAKLLNRGGLNTMILKASL